MTLGRRSRISGTGDEEFNSSELRANVRVGLFSTPKDMSPWPGYHYDARGSALFDSIMNAPEYYQTSAERSLLNARAEEVVRRSGCTEILELGSGSAEKTEILIRAALDAAEVTGGLKTRYVPMDVSRSALEESVERLTVNYPALDVLGVLADYEKPLSEVLVRSSATLHRRLVVCLGGTIGNLPPERRQAMLAEISESLQPGECVLVGIDLVKDVKKLEAAYNDAGGLSEKFNKNLLLVLNERLGTNFDPDLFVHRSFYHHEEQRIEAWLDSATKQSVLIPGFEIAVQFDEGEGMRSAISVKFTDSSARQMLEDVGFEASQLFIDDGEMVGLLLGTKQAAS